jgi:glycosyltransferase involved in cell wall biosynthesis
MKPGKNGILISSMDDIVTCFQNISKMPVSNYEYLSNNSLKIYKEKFSLEKMVSQYLNLLKSVS